MQQELNQHQNHPQGHGLLFDGLRVRCRLIGVSLGRHAVNSVEASQIVLPGNRTGEFDQCRWRELLLQAPTERLGHPGGSSREGFGQFDGQGGLWIEKLEIPAARGIALLVGGALSSAPGRGRGRSKIALHHHRHPQLGQECYSWRDMAIACSQRCHEREADQARKTPSVNLDRFNHGSKATASQKKNQAGQPVGWLGLIGTWNRASCAKNCPLGHLP